MPFVALNTISLKTPDLTRTLISDLSVSFGHERTGLVGRNGCGKSSLLAVLAGRVPPFSGSIDRFGKIGLFRQRFDDLSISVVQALGMQGAFDTNNRIVAGTGSEADFAAADWTLDGRIETAFERVGLQRLAMDTPLARLSGGQRMRVSVARTLLEEADLLLLDEPTNNLDASGRQMITELISDWRGGVVVAGHDRALLEQMDRMLHLSAIGAQLYSGGWSAYRTERHAERVRATSELERAARAIKTTQAALQRQNEKQSRRDKAGRTKRAQDNEPRVSLDRKKGQAEQSAGRQNRLADHLLNQVSATRHVAEQKVEVLAPILIDLLSGRVPPNRVHLRMEAAQCQLCPAKTFGPWSLEIRGSDRMRIIGPNGAGKSTLMKLAAGLLDPSVGLVERFAHIAHLDQDLSVPDTSGRLVDNLLLAQHDITEHDARAALARYGFRNMLADRPVSGLSGGERLRLSLCMAMTLTTMPELILLDEPTNHLDIEAIELLETTLKGYEGALLFVTHDERFAEALRPFHVYEIG